MENQELVKRFHEQEREGGQVKKVEQKSTRHTQHLGTERKDEIKKSITAQGKLEPSTMMIDKYTRINVQALFLVFV